jgi:hypothetical protein
MARLSRWELSRKSIGACVEGAVDHARLSEAIDLSSRELTLLLQGLLRQKYLERVGRGRGCLYRIPEAGAPVGSTTTTASSEHYAGNSEHYATNSEHTDLTALKHYPRSK